MLVFCFFREPLLQALSSGVLQGGMVQVSVFTGLQKRCAVNARGYWLAKDMLL
jgi:hypothetical protein